MDEKAAAETDELLEVEREAEAAEAMSEPPAEAIPDPPETAVGVIHELGSIAAMVSQHAEDLAGLRREIDSVRAEVAGVARAEARHLLDTILEEAQSGEAAEEHQEEMTARKPRWWEAALGGR